MAASQFFALDGRVWRRPYTKNLSTHGSLVNRLESAGFGVLRVNYTPNFIQILRHSLALVEVGSAVSFGGGISRSGGL